MNKHLFWTASFVTASVVLASCGNSAKQAQQNPADMAVPVVTTQVSKEHITGIDTYPATIVPINEVELRGEVGGYITAIFIKDGQQVNKGQKLYEIDRSKYQAAYNQAAANVAIAKANLDKAQKDADRYNKLAQQDAIAKQRVDYALTDLNNAKSQLAAAQAQADNARVDLNKSIIVAPFAGTIGISQVKLGALITPGSTLLNTISSDNPIAADIAIGQDEIPRFNRLRTAKTDSLFTLAFSDQSVYRYSGSIYTIDRAVDPQTGTIKIRLSFPNPQHALRAGMTANVRVLNNDTGEQVVIPYKAVTEQMGEYYVFVVNNNVVSQHNVKLGSRSADKIVVREGLKEGETIVVDGIQNLRDGSKITEGEANKQSQK